MEIRISRANGGSLIPIGIVSPSAELDMLLGSQQGGVAVLSSGDFWVNGQMRDRNFQPFAKGDTVRIEIMDGKTLMINGQKVWEHRGGVRHPDSNSVPANLGFRPTERRALESRLGSSRAGGLPSAAMVTSTHSKSSAMARNEADFDGVRLYNTCSSS